MTRETSPTRPSRRWSPDWNIIGVGVAIVGLLVSDQIQSAGDRARAAEGRAAIRADLHRIETTFGERLARIEQALFGSPAKIPSADEGQFGPPLREIRYTRRRVRDVRWEDLSPIPGRSRRLDCRQVTRTTELTMNNPISSYDQEVREALHVDEGRIGQVWRLMVEEGKSPQDTQAALGLASLGTVNYCKGLIDTIERRKCLTKGPSLAGQRASGLRGFAKRHSESLSEDTRGSLEVLAEEHQRVSDNAEARVEEAREKESTSGLKKGEPGIYVYCLPHYMRHPVMHSENENSLDRTYLKVGMSDVDVTKRIKQQSTTALPEPPLVLRRYVARAGNPDYVELEKKMHTHLNAADHNQNRSRGAGKEWFLTHLTFIDSTADLLDMEIKYEDEAYPADYSV